MFDFLKSKPAPEPAKSETLKKSLSSLIDALSAPVKTIQYPLRSPELMPGVVPAGTQPAIAMDADFSQAAYRYLQGGAGLMVGFPGYQYLSMLALRPEYRTMVVRIALERTRQWITLQSTETASDKTKQKITELTQELTKCNLQRVMQTAAEHDGFFGRGQFFIDIKGADRSLPMVLDSRTISKNSFLGIRNVEPMWTSPIAYNAIDPTAPDFYKPARWWMLGVDVHASRMQTIITRPLPDILKPAFNFSGISLSQLAEPYVDNWIRTRKSISDLLYTFSTTALKTSMDQVLNGVDDGNLINRVKLFIAGKSNQGVMLLDKDREEIMQLNVPLGGLSELQAQAEEHMGLPSGMPMIILTGISPSGLNASSDGEIRVWYDFISANQEAYDRPAIKTVLDVIQISKYGEIDPDITFIFNPLMQMSDKELADLRKSNSDMACQYIDRGVLDASEERERLARDSDSGYQGLELEVDEEAPDETDDPDVEKFRPAG